MNGTQGGGRRKVGALSPGSVGREGWTRGGGLACQFSPRQSCSRRARSSRLSDPTAPALIDSLANFHQCF